MRHRAGKSVRAEVSVERLREVGGKALGSVAFPDTNFCFFAHSIQFFDTNFRFPTIQSSFSTIACVFFDNQSLQMQNIFLTLRLYETLNM